MCVFSSSQSQCPCALASLPPPLCVSLFTGNAGEPYGWLGWCEATWRLQRAGNLACQAGQHGASRQSIKYSIQHSQFMDLILQIKTPSKMIKKENHHLSKVSLEQPARCVSQNQGAKAVSGDLSLVAKLERNHHCRTSYRFAVPPSPYFREKNLSLLRVKVQKCVMTFSILCASIHSSENFFVLFLFFWKKRSCC